jgi:hypothetical protein
MPAASYNSEVGVLRYGGLHNHPVPKLRHLLEAESDAV